MGSKKTKQESQPAFPSETQGVRSDLSNILQTKGAQGSPFYSDLSRMFENTIGAAGDRFQLPDYITNTLQNAATTGMPSLTPLQQTPFYQAVSPSFQDIIGQTKAATAEQFGAQGGLRSSDYATAAGKGIMSALSSQLMNVAQQAYSLEEAAKGRQLQGATTGIEAAMAPYNMATQAAGAGTAVEKSQYPLLDIMTALATAGAGQQGKTYAYPGEQISGGISCCFIFIQGEGKLTQTVRWVRDNLIVSMRGGSRVAKGYKRMAKWLVPLMQRNILIQSLVKLFMTSPMSKFANWITTNHKGGGFIFYPLSCFWITVWYKLGR